MIKKLVLVGAVLMNQCEAMDMCYVRSSRQAQVLTEARGVLCEFCTNLSTVLQKLENGEDSDFIDTLAELCDIACYTKWFFNMVQNNKNLDQGVSNVLYDSLLVVLSRISAGCKIASNRYSNKNSLVTTKGDVVFDCFRQLKIIE